MAKYKLVGLITDTIIMEVEADNLQEAMDRCEESYDFEEFDDAEPIIRDGKPIVEKNEWAMDLQDIKPKDRHLY